MKASATLLPIVLSSIALLTGCATSQEARVAAVAPVAEAKKPVLTQSLFSKDASGSIGEADLQKVLESPIDLQFPARVGVVPLAKPFDPGSEVSIVHRGIASHDLATALSGQTYFQHVSDISTDLPNPGGLEGLRAIAARYRLRYLLLYSERFEDRTHLNGWAWLYPTFVGMFIAPGVTVQSQGIAQADLLDVRTGTVLFSVVEPMEVKSQQLMIGAARTHQSLQETAGAEAARRLAKRVSAQTNQLIAFAEQEGKRDAHASVRILPAPVLVDPAPAATSARAP